MRTCFVDPSAVTAGKIFITDESDISHIVNVLRKKRGDLIMVSDGTGRKYTGRIEELSARSMHGVARDGGNGKSHNVIGSAGNSDSHNMTGSARDDGLRGAASGDSSRSQESTSDTANAERRIVLSIEDVVQYNPVRTRITLYQCVPKHGKMEVIIQKATELGIEGFVPVFSERSVPKKENPDTKMKRWMRIAEEASKQSGRDAVPFVKEPLSFIAAVSELGEFDLLLFPYENEKGITIKDVLTEFAASKFSAGKEPIAADSGIPCGADNLSMMSEEPKSISYDDDNLYDVASEQELNIEATKSTVIPGLSRDPSDVSQGDRIALIIGPEGGFTESEAEMIRRTGGMPCSLGGTILRTETAGSAAIAMILYELEL